MIKFLLLVKCPILGLTLLQIIFNLAEADVMCSNPPPGVRKLVRGVDITRLDLVPMWDALGNNGFKSPVISFTCNDGNVWKDNDKQYQLPDQVWQMTSTPGGWLSANSKLYKSFSDVRTTMSSSVGGEGMIKKFGFSASKTYTRMMNTITNTSRYVTDTSSFDSATRVDLIPSWILTMDKYANMYVNRFIVGNYTSSKANYEKFIKLFGTHYMSKGNFGGFIRVINEISTDYFYSKTDNDAKRNAKASFLKVLSAHGSKVSGSTTVDSTFTKESTQTIRYFGGNTNLMSSQGIAQWQPTVAADPWLFSGELAPISDLITEPIKKAGMIEAVQQYILRSYLDELANMILSVKGKLNSPLLDALLARVNTLKGLDHLDETAVEAMGNDIEKDLLVPDWFSARTKLCFKWRPDGDGGQCGGGAGRLLCALPNAMTSVYRDDTDGRGGGCRMQWGIQTSSSFPTWFKSVQICYQWRADGDGGQCGGGARPLLCAPVNGFSPEYRDDTDGRGGGCRMQWKLVVPSSAPLWLKTAKICFSWYPDGDGGQCGPAPSRNICAVANQWTGQYRDDTDGRPGGCRMSWGMKTVL